MSTGPEYFGRWRGRGLAQVAGSLLAGQGGGEFHTGLHGVSAGAVAVADRGRCLQVCHRGI